MDGLVTVVIPVYNVERFLDRCVASVVNQSYQNLEIILVDDGSPDRCPEMCEEWAKRDERIRVVHKVNEGLGMARNTGIEYANGEYICFFDSDDYVERNFVELMLAKATAEMADVVICGMKNVNKAGRVIRETVPETICDVFTGCAVRETFLPDLIASDLRTAENKGMAFSACSCLFSTGKIRDIQWRFASEKEIISEDSYSLIRLYSSVQKVAIVNKALYYYCQNESSLTQTFRADRFEKVKVFYRETQRLTDMLQLSGRVSERIACLTISFAIDAIKQIAASGLPWAKQIAATKQIVRDEIVKELFRAADCQFESKSKSLMSRIMKNGFGLTAWLLAKARNVQQAV